MNSDKSFISCVLDASEIFEGNLSDVSGAGGADSVCDVGRHAVGSAR